MTDFVTIAYAIYIPLTIVLTFYVAKVLFQNGRVFMLEIFRGDAEAAHATNRLFRIGFYLLNVGFAFLIMTISSYRVKALQDVFEVLSNKLGGFSIYLGITLFFILFAMLRGRRHARRSTLPQIATTES